MKLRSTLFLKIAIALFGLFVLALCVLVLPEGIADDKTGDYVYILLAMYATTVPFYAALYQVLKLLSYVDKGSAFSAASVLALKKVKISAAVLGAMYTVGLPYIYFTAQDDDAPGVIALGLLITGAAFVISAAAALMQKLVQHAVDIKSENDLTV